MRLFHRGPLFPFYSLTCVDINHAGHSGESPEVPFVREHDPPANESDRLRVLREMHAHSQFCYSGDHTLQATQKAIDTLAQMEDSDERCVPCLSLFPTAGSQPPEIIITNFAAFVGS